MTRKMISRLVLAAGIAVAPGSASAGYVSDAVNFLCGLLNSTGEAQCSPEAQAAAKGTNI